MSVEPAESRPVAACKWS